MQNNIICLDFDGVIHRYSMGWGDGVANDIPMEGAKEAIEKLEKRGYEVVIFSCRSEESIKEWLKKYDFPDIEVAKEKPKALAYIDDRGIRFTNWKDILNYF